ncbi:uncharacterized protein [Macrobrachium rosenbergii]|uniref:uncharacterized protein n=1 Tax=Macrobrachium rosenbergii TaxID=79674 RepID=UPI0034D52091
MPITLKSESETRWSAREETVKPICHHFDDLVILLEEMSTDLKENVDTRSEASQHRILTFHFLALLFFWNLILSKIDRIQKRLQDHQINVHNAAKAICNESLSAALELCANYDVMVELRTRIKKRMPGETATDVGLSAKQEIMRLMKGTIDRLHTEMKQRSTRLEDLDNKFRFLLDVEQILKKGKSSGFLDDERTRKTLHVGEFYSSDLDGNELYEEILDCRMLLASRTDVQISIPEKLVQFIIQYGDENVFPNLRVAIQLMLTVAISIASCERSFSKPKLIAAYLRASMGQDTLNALVFLSTEREEVELINSDDVIDNFTSAKSRRVQI